MSFDASFETIVMDPGMEGGLKLTDDPADPGKLTFAGISSASWPGWPGWAVIESARKQGTLKSEGVRSVLLKLVQGFYKKEFWDCWKCGAGARAFRAIHQPRPPAHLPPPPAGAQRPERRSRAGRVPLRGRPRR